MKHKNTIPPIEIWQKVDKILGLVIENLDDSAYLLVASDHGFGPEIGAFYSNTWLEQEGLLSWQGGISLSLHAFINKAIEMLPKFSPRLYNDLAAWARRNRPKAILNAKGRSKK